MAKEIGPKEKAMRERREQVLTTREAAAKKGAILKAARKGDKK